MKAKRNFRSPLEIEQHLYKVSQLILEGKLNASQGHALVNASKAWLKAHEERKIMELEQRVRYQEAEKELKAAKAKKGGR
jgi:hypothetical protein